MGLQLLENGCQTLLRNQSVNHNFNDKIYLKMGVRKTNCSNRATPRTTRHSTLMRKLSKVWKPETGLLQDDSP